MSQALDREILFHLQGAWRQVNYQLFDSQLHLPSFELTESTELLGCWHSQRRLISIQRKLIFEAPWLEVVEVLKHEIAHQFISEVLEVTDETPHGPCFQKVCAERGINHAARGSVERSPRVYRLLERVNKLLALAESENPHEAERAAEKARMLLAKHHVTLNQESSDLTWLRHEMVFKQLGSPKGRHYQYEYALINVLAKHFFVSAVWVSAFCVHRERPGRVVEICGREEDVEIAAYVYDFMLNHLQIAWKAYRRTHQPKGLKTKLSYFLGMIEGFAAKLTRQEEQFDEGERALIQLSGARAVAYQTQRYQHMKTKSIKGWRPTGDYHKGYREGQQLTLRKGVVAEASTTNLKSLSFESST